MTSEFSTGSLQIGTPNTINKVLGNGLIPFLSNDGKIYMVDVRGNVQDASTYIKGQGSTYTAATTNDLP